MRKRKFNRISIIRNTHNIESQKNRKVILMKRRMMVRYSKIVDMKRRKNKKTQDIFKDMLDNSNIEIMMRRLAVVNMILKIKNKISGIMILKCKKKKQILNKLMNRSGMSSSNKWYEILHLECLTRDLYINNHLLREG